MQMTIQFKGVWLDVHCDYQPFESAERGPEAQYPGCSEHVEVEEVYITGTHADASELLEDQFEEIAEKILENIHDDQTEDKLSKYGL